MGQKQIMIAIRKMSRFVPHQRYFDWLKRAAFCSDIMLYGSALISILRLSLEHLSGDWTGLKTFFDCLLVWIAVAYIVIDGLQMYLFYKAESCRKLDLIDNSLNTKFSKDNSVGYYSNDEVEPGIYKLGVNGFENSFFTMSITDEMLKKDVIKYVLIFVLSVGVAIISIREITFLVFQSALIISIVMRAFKLIVLNRRVTSIFQDYKSTFTCVRDDQMSNLIIKNIIFYEKTLSWAGITLDDGIFKKMNSKLSEKWENIKASHCVRS